MYLTQEEQAVAVIEAIRACIDPVTQMAHLPDVIAQCELSGMSHGNAYNVVNRWSGSLWRRIGSSICMIQLNPANERE
jgi:hypothetical protein